MESPIPPRLDVPPARPSLISRVHPLALLALMLWHGWMTLSLFGPGEYLYNLTSADPIISGRHALHLYHGYLGAHSLCERGTSCCYDPAFQAGYPKTPVFDSGSRPAELFLLLGGGEFQPMAYKLGFAACCLLGPLLIYLAAASAGLAPGTSCLAVFFSLLLWWGVPGRQLLENGNLDVLLAGLAALLQAGLLVRYHRFPTLAAWLALLFASCLGWFGEPLLFALVLPLLLIYYLSVGARHRLIWHIGLFAGAAGGILANGYWMIDWLSCWWVRAPLRAETPLLSHHTFHTFWAAPLWGSEADRLLAASLIGLGMVGIWILNETQQRPAARLLGFGALGFLGLAIAGGGCEALADLGTTRFLVPGLWLVSLPAAVTCTGMLHYSKRLLGKAWAVGLVWAAVAALLGFFGRQTVAAIGQRCLVSTPLHIGFSPEDQAAVNWIDQNTTGDARILWEDDVEDRTGSFWTPLLPLMTGRAFVGGLDPATCIEHMFASLSSHKLADRPLDSWTDRQLREFCRHYHIGWIICRSPAATARFGAWKDASAIRAPTGGVPFTLFSVPASSFAIKGQARLVEANEDHITLADVVPQDGVVVISMHYQAGFHVSPSRVQIEREPDPRDPISFLRLRLSAPVARLTLTWPGR
jgi:hypothetical protein